MKNGRSADSTQNDPAFPPRAKAGSLIAAALAAALSAWSPAVMAADIYVDSTLSANCTSGNYSAANRDCSGSDGDAYNTLQAVVWGTDGTDPAMQVGDTVILRGGTYTESYGGTSSTGGAAMQISLLLSGSGWSPGSYSTIRSYPDEWAILDGGNGAAGHYFTLGFGSLSSGDMATYTLSYWVFERLEVVGGSSSGIAVNGGPVRIRYCHIHDNGFGPNGDNNRSGILLGRPNGSTIEYSFIENNAGDGDNNKAQVTFYSDYHYAQYDIDHATRQNIIRYNLFGPGSYAGFKNKASQKLTGYDSDMYDHPCAEEETTYRSYGDKIHHNLFLGLSAYGILAHQDYQQIYQNILEDCDIASEDGGNNWAHLRTSWYNNTVINGLVKQTIGRNQSCSMFAGGWFMANNIIDLGNVEDYSPTVGIYVMQCGGTGCEETGGEQYIWDDTRVDCNLLHSPDSQTQHYGYSASYNHKATKWVDTASFNAARSTTNYTNSDSGLFIGDSGADRFIADHAFVVSGSATVGDGGCFGAHPYLTNVTIPSFLGATNPDDHDWVDGVLSDVSSVAWLCSNTQDRDANDDPTWIEGGTGPVPCGDLGGQCCGVNEVCEGGQMHESSDCGLGCCVGGTCTTASVDGGVDSGPDGLDSGAVQSDASVIEPSSSKDGGCNCVHAPFGGSTPGVESLVLLLLLLLGAARHERRCDHDRRF